MSYNKKNVSPTSKINACYQEMDEQLHILKNEVTFREFIGFELCFNIFKRRLGHYIKESKE